MANEQIGLTAVFDDKDFQKGLGSYQKGIQEAEKSTEKTASLMSKAGDIAKGAFAIGIGAAAAGVAAFVGGAKIGIDALSDWNDQVNTLSDNLGTSGAQSSKWAVAFNHVGLTVEEGGAGLNFFTKQLGALGKEMPKSTTTVKDNSAAIEKLHDQLEKAETRLARATERMQSAKEPTKAMQYAVEDAQKAVNDLNEKLASTPATITNVSTAVPKLSPFAEALKRLGVEAKDSQGNLRTFDEIMPDMLDAFQKLPPGIDKSALAMELFGARAGTKFLDFLSQGSAGLEQARQFAEDFGLELDTDASASIEEFGFIMNDVNLGVKGFLMVIGKEMLPIVRELAQVVLKDVLPPMITWAKENLPNIVQGVKNVVKEIGPFVLGLIDVGRQLADVLTGGDLMEDFGADFAALFGDNEKAVADFVYTLGAKFKEGREKVLEFWVQISPTLDKFVQWMQTDGVDALKVFFDKVGLLETSTLPKWNKTMEEMGKTWELLFGKNGLIKTDSEITLPSFASLVELTMTRAQIIVESKLDFLYAIFKTFNDILRGDWEQVFKQDLPNILNEGFDFMLGNFAQDGEALRMAFYNKMQEIARDMKQAGIDFVVNLMQGIEFQSQMLAEFIHDLVENAWDSALGALGLGGGPSFAGRSFGGAEMTMAMLNNGNMQGAPPFNTSGQFQQVGSSVLSQNILNQGARSVQIIFSGSGGPSSQSEASMQGAMVVNELHARGIDF